MGYLKINGFTSIAFENGLPVQAICDLNALPEWPTTKEFAKEVRDTLADCGWDVSVENIRFEDGEYYAPLIGDIVCERQEAVLS